jgi:hypothetical protein
MPNIRRSLIAACAIAGLAGTPLAAVAQSPAGTPEALSPFDPSTAVATIDNAYFPLRPGTVFVYDGTADGDAEHEEVTVLQKTKTILGVPCVVVRDVVSVKGEVIEDTQDWYVQDTAGNVWYMGEAAKAFENGKTSTEGSWEAGVDGALPGIIMPAKSVVGQTYEQEYYSGVAEDMAQATKLDATVKIGNGTYDHVLVTKEWSPLEPAVVEEKSYAPGIGLIKDISVKGANEQLELTSVTGPGATPTPGNGG